MAILYRFVWGPICAYLDNQDREQARIAAEIGEKLAEIETLKAQWSDKLAKIEETANQIKSAARAEAETAKLAEMAKISAERQSILAGIHDQLKREEAKLIQSVEARLSNWVITIASQVIQREISPENRVWAEKQLMAIASELK